MIQEITIMDNPVVIDNSDWYQSLVDDCKAIITEAIFTSSWALVEGYHTLGERIVADSNYQKESKGNYSSLQRVAKNIGVSERTLYYAVQFYSKFPDLSLLPLGKDASWRKVIALLPEQKEEPEEPTNFDNIIEYIDRMKDYMRATLELADNIRDKRVYVSPAQATLVYDQTSLMYGLWDNLRHQLYENTGMEKS